MRRTLTALALLASLLAPRAGAAREPLRVGVQYAGHLLFTDVVGAELEWAPLHRPGATWARELSVAGGVALSVDGGFQALPVLLRADLLHLDVAEVWQGGFELAAGIVLTHAAPSFAMTPVLCAALALTREPFRLRPELCADVGARTFEGIGDEGFLRTAFGIGASYAF